MRPNPFFKRGIPPLCKGDDFKTTINQNPNPKNSQFSLSFDKKLGVLILVNGSRNHHIQIKGQMTSSLMFSWLLLFLLLCWPWLTLANLLCSLNPNSKFKLQIWNLPAHIPEKQFNRCKNKSTCIEGLDGGTSSSHLCNARPWRWLLTHKTIWSVVINVDHKRGTTRF